jgi:DNA-binding transcriptional ArsR family regulator
VEVDGEGGPAVPPGNPAPPADVQRTLGALGDPVAVKLLSVLSRGERSGHDLVIESGLPQSSVYRKLRELQDAALVIVPRLAFTPEGRKVELFRTQVREVRVEFVRGRVRVTVLRREDSADRIHDLWRQVRGA